MRTFLAGCLFSLFSVLLVSCGTRTGGNPDVKAAMTDSAHFTTIQWMDSLSRNYGAIPEGQKLNVTFRFRNIGTTPLVIGHVQPSCGCTVAEQPEKPVAPGEEGQIRATFNSQGRSGLNHKTLFVDANTKGVQRYSLQFLVQVDKKPS
jgi:Protein of unknown function (DUF1573)